MSKLVVVDRLLPEGEPNVNGIVILGIRDVLEELLSNSSDPPVYMYDPAYKEDMLSILSGGELSIPLTKIGSLFDAYNDRVVLELLEGTEYYEDLLSHSEKYGVAFIVSASKSEDGSIHAKDLLLVQIMKKDDYANLILGVKDTSSTRLSTTSQVDGELMSSDSTKSHYMSCISCHSEMECYDDVTDVGARLDFIRCPKCSSEADLVRSVSTGEILRVYWRKVDKV